MRKIRVLLADDHPLIREGFKSLLGRNASFEVVGEAENGRELIEAVMKLEPDVVLLDINMPEMSGIEAMKAIMKEYSGTRFIMLTMHEEREYVIDALREGASGYILKNVDGPELERAITRVYEGEKYFTASITSTLAEVVAKPSKPELRVDITPREKEVLNLVASGQSTKQIADALDISIRTVESHRINMLKKLGVNNSAELIRKCVELGIL